MFQPSLAFNLLIDREPPSESAVAVAPALSSGPTYFLYPALGGVLAGTAHRPWHGDVAAVAPDEDDIQQFLQELNASIPRYGLRREHVRRVFSGLLPVSAPGTTQLTTQAAIVEHGRRGGPTGLLSVSGVKFTTARLTAERTLRIVARYIGQPLAPASGSRPASGLLVDIDAPDQSFGPAYLAALRRQAHEESAITIDDLIMRRTNWGVTSRDPDTLRSRLAVALTSVPPDTADSRSAAAPAPRLRTA